MYKELEDNNILNRIERIIEDKFNISINKISEDYINENLLGKRIRLEARDLLYLLFEVEKEFNIRIPEESISAEEFATLNGIAQVVKKHIKLKAAI